MPIFMNFLGRDAVNDAFLKIDADFLKLSKAGPDFLLELKGPQIKHEISVIGGAFDKLGDAFIKLSDAALKIDDLFLKYAPPPTTVPTLTAASVGGDAPDPQADFLKLDAGLKLLGGDLGTAGADFVKLDKAPTYLTFKLTEVIISSDFAKVSTDTSAVGGQFGQLGDDLLKLSTGPTNSVELNNAWKVLGDEFHKISSAFDAVAVDWNKLSQDFATLGGAGGGTNTSALVASSSSGGPSPSGQVGSDFLKLEHDFVLLSQALGASGPDLVKAFDALVDQSGKSFFEQIEHLASPPSGGH
jgi:hypothetical protein